MKANQHMAFIKLILILRIARLMAYLVLWDCLQGMIKQNFRHLDHFVVITEMYKCNLTVVRGEHNL
jgi:hypothetical protein